MKSFLYFKIPILWRKGESFGSFSLKMTSNLAPPLSTCASSIPCYPFTPLLQPIRYVHDTHRESSSVLSPIPGAKKKKKEERYVSKFLSSATSSPPPSFGRPAPRHGRLSGRKNTDLETQLRHTRTQLRQTREQLAHVQQQLHATKQEQVLAQVVHPLLERLTQQDVAAHKAATEARYTAMALEMSVDRLEVELRRVLSIGLTDDEVDVAAIQAGARQYIRANIGYRAERVSEEPPVAISLGTSEMVTTSNYPRE